MHGLMQGKVSHLSASSLDLSGSHSFPASAWWQRATGWQPLVAVDGPVAHCHCPLAGKLRLNFQKHQRCHGASGDPQPMGRCKSQDRAHVQEVPPGPLEGVGRGVSLEQNTTEAWFACEGTHQDRQRCPHGEGTIPKDARPSLAPSALLSSAQLGSA